MASEPKLLTPNVHSFDEFWRWLQGHPNCVINVGTPETVIYDHDDLHWNFEPQEGGTGNMVVQLIRGKTLVGEVVITPHDIAYVQVEARSEEEFFFECVGAGEEDTAPYFFTLSHDYSIDDPPRPPGKWVH